MLKNNNNKKLVLTGFGFLLGIWCSLSFMYYELVYYLWVLGFFGVGISFTGFVYYWMKYNNVSNVFNRSNRKKTNNKGGL